MNKHLLLLIIGIILNTSFLLAQPEYNMSDDEVIDCTGILLDSDVGEEGHYALNEFFTFTICPPNADLVTITFSTFCTEEINDVLSFYDGPDSGAPLIAAYSGTYPTGFSVPATSGCLTIEFITDGSINCTGWEAEWEAEIEELAPLEDLVIADVECFSNSFQMISESPILCSSVNVDAFSIFNGGFPIEVISVEPLNCDEQGFTQAIAITTAEDLDKSGEYLMTFNYTYVDICEEEHELNGSVNFNVVGCPLTVDIELSVEEVCQGSCIEIYADANGGDSDDYSYQWSPSLPNNEGPHEICPTEESYSVTVTDNASGGTVTDTYTFSYIDEVDAGLPASICAQGGAYLLEGTPTGGSWEGEYVNSDTGMFEPVNAAVGQNWVYYNYSGCVDSVQITVLEGWGWWDQGVCPNSGDFQVAAGTPAGGVWSGDYISPDGEFDTTAPIGTHVVTYTAPNGCTANKNVFLQEISVQADTIFCQGDPVYTIDRTPYWGGWWDAHPGFENTWSGKFTPADAGPGIHQLIYYINGGCSDTINIEVTEIVVPGQVVFCPEEGIVQLPEMLPLGGTLTSISSEAGVSGIIDADAGTYNADLIGVNFDEDLLYEVNGCSDILEVKIRQTNIGFDYFEFCLDDANMALNWANVNRSPSGGNWSGPGIVNPGNHNSPFNPSLAGPGTHTLYYAANTCMDSMTVVVYDPLNEPITICEAGAPFNIEVDPPGGEFNGDGIIDVFNGTFNPAIGVGTYTIGYEFGDGCYDETQVIVEEQEFADLENIASYFCFKDTLVALTANPIGGVLSGPGVDSLAATFNPVLAGEGFHVLEYHYGEAECSSTDQITVEVGSPISVSLSAQLDSVCFGDGTLLQAVGVGGQSQYYDFVWTPDLGNGNEHYVAPENTTTYSVYLTDGCTQSAPQSIPVFVHPEIQYEITTSDLVCDNEQGSANINLLSDSNYAFQWSDNLGNTSMINTREGVYEVTITNTETNCALDDEVLIPAYPPISANFVPTQNQADCFPRLDFNLIDQSTGGTTGYWDFGDGTIIDYQIGDYPAHTYTIPGDYTIQLYIENEGGCNDTYLQEICVRPPNSLLVPNAFSPNNDGVNDLFQAQGIGVTDFSMKVYDRWGQLLYATNDINQGWDGAYQGEIQGMGVYVYYIQFTDLWHKEEQSFHGNITLLR